MNYGCEGRVTLLLLCALISSESSEGRRRVASALASPLRGKAGVRVRTQRHRIDILSYNTFFPPEHRQKQRLFDIFIELPLYRAGEGQKETRDERERGVNNKPLHSSV